MRIVYERLKFSERDKGLTVNQKYALALFVRRHTIAQKSSSSFWSPYSATDEIQTFTSQRFHQTRNVVSRCTFVVYTFDISSSWCTHTWYVFAKPRDFPRQKRQNCATHDSQTGTEWTPTDFLNVIRDDDFIATLFFSNTLCRNVNKVGKYQSTNWRSPIVIRIKK